MYCTHGYHWLLWLLWWWWWWLLLWQVHLDADQVVLKYLVPWQEVVADMYDEVKSVSSGYASFDYNEAGSERADVVCVDMLINGEAIDALSFVCR
jgi:translation elongation factor EF-4